MGPRPPHSVPKRSRSSLHRWRRSTEVSKINPYSLDTLFLACCFPMVSFIFLLKSFVTILSHLREFWLHLCHILKLQDQHSIRVPNFRRSLSRRRSDADYEIQHTSDVATKKIQIGCFIVCYPINPEEGKYVLQVCIS